MTAPFVHQTSGRNRRTIGVLVTVYAALAFVLVFLQAAPWIVALLTLPTLPALWDIASNRPSGLRLGDGKLSWYSGKRRWEIPFDQIDHLRFDTRLDMSVRVSAVTPDRQRIRLAYDALPHHRALEAAAIAQGLRVERHHFSLI